MSEAIALPQPCPLVLVVDDDPDFLRNTVRRVTRLGYEVDGASDARDAQSLAAKRNYDIALIDLNMQVNGIELMAQIARQSPNTAFVLVTGTPDVRDEDTRSIGQHLTAVLLKPFREPELRATLTEALQARLTRSSNASPAAAVRVLLVEDSPSAAFLLSETLQLMGGFTITHVSRLSDAVRLLHDEVFDTVITDLTLSDALGLGAVVKLRQAAPDVTLLVYSAAPDEELALRAIELGAQDFLIKGIGDESIGRALRFARVRRQAERRLVTLAHTDALTGLANRIAFSSALDRAMLAVRRHGTPVSLLFIDLDGFKAVNDEYGHEAGDALLRVAAGRIRACARDYDVVARLGGDEFAILATAMPDDALDALRARLVESISSEVFVGSSSIRVTASVGIATCPKDAQDAAGFVHFADQAMYAAKRSGRDSLQRAAPPSGA